MGHALRTAYEAAGVTQKEIAAAAGVDQTTVSKWAKGQRWPPLNVLPIIDELCGQPRGHVLRLAGYVEDADGDVLAAIVQAAALTDEIDRQVMVEVYKIFSKRERGPTVDEVNAAIIARAEGIPRPATPTEGQGAAAS